MKKLLTTAVLLALLYNVYAQSNSRLATDVAWLNAANVRTAFGDICKIKGYDAARYEAKVKELESLCNLGFTGFDTGNQEAQLRAEKAVVLKRDKNQPLFLAPKLVYSTPPI